MKRTRTLLLSTGISILIAGATATAQEWDTTVGDPGVTHPYLTHSIFALRVFDDGNGEMLYVGGNFDDVAGVPNTPLIARWERDSNTWSSVGGGLDNGFVNEMVPFDAGGGPELVVGGSFAGAFGVPGTDNIAKWDGSAWSSLGGSLDGPVWTMTTWDDGSGEMLYVGGSFTTAGGVTANGIAAWDGVQWHSLGAGITGSFSPYVASMMAFDDGSGEKLYVGGRYDTMDGLSTPLIARWDGVAWEQVGSGLINNLSFFGIESMEVFDDGSGPALYVGGYEFHPPGLPTNDIYKWDGVQWTANWPIHDGRVTDLLTFDDGDGPYLYRVGNAAADLKYFARLEGNDWQTVGGGVTKDPYSSPWPSTSALCAWDGALYVAGFFNRAGVTEPCGCIAAWGIFDPGTGYCFGDPGSGTPCPCANENDGSVPGSGCANGAFASGANLTGSGKASLLNDTLVLATTGLEPNNSGLYFQADNDLSPGNVWGDGLQCAGGQLKRLGVRFSDASGYSDTSGYATSISVKAGNVLPGDTKYYQCWYRNPTGSLCGSDFNASNGYAVTWLP